MADEQSTSTGADDAVDTSVDGNDGAGDDDVELEDIEVSLDDISGEDDDEEQSDSEDLEAETDESEEETESEDEESTELSDEDKRKQEAREYYEQRKAERQARIDRVKQDQADYIAEASENSDLLELAVRQLQVTEYNNTVERVENTVTNQYQKALNDFAVLRNTDPVIQAEIDEVLDAFQARYVTVDQYGNATDVRGDLYATLQAKADSITKLTGIRAANQERSKGKEKSKTLVTPTRAPREPKVDPDMAAFDEEANR